ncbi:transposase [Phocaeicola sp.]|uniref:transposase n=1 Tax=Bacteroidaceae TaxID=815 RepID=UPI00307C0B1C
MESFISTRPDECPSKFQVLPKHWIVERSFSWLENFRILTIDCEFLAKTAKAMVRSHSFKSCLYFSRH